MRKLLYFIIILLIIFFILGIVVYYKGHVLIDKGDTYYIKTKFRPYTLYKDEGTYIFPEKLLYYDKDAFTMHKLSKESKELIIPLKIELENFSILKDENKYEIEYDLLINYSFTESYQIDLIHAGKKHNTNDEGGHKDFTDWVSTVDKDIVFSIIKEELNRKDADALNKIETLNNNDKNNKQGISSLKEILQRANAKLYKDIRDKYPKEKILIKSIGINHKYKRGISLKLYKSRLNEAEKLEEEFIKTRIRFVKEDKLDEIKWDKKYSYARREIELLRMYGKLFKESPSALKYYYIKELSKTLPNVRKQGILSKSLDIFSKDNEEESRHSASEDITTKKAIKEKALEATSIEESKEGSKKLINKESSNKESSN